MQKAPFDLIKKQNGEKFAKSIRDYDNGIFDIPNIIEIVKYAGRDAEPILKYLISLKNIQIEDLYDKNKSPFELLYQAGYSAEYADTLEKQNSIKPYFCEGEELCTFRDETRYIKYYIINAVKHDVKKIKRANFKNPMREDEYATSVLSIQILKSGGFISIKNRYNHIVSNPDNTFNSNPDNIIYGLSKALKAHFNVDFSSQKISLPNNYVIVNNKIIKYNYEINNVYFAEDLYVKDGQIHELDKGRHVMMDYFVLDFQSKTILNPANIKDGLISALEPLLEDKKAIKKFTERNENEAPRDFTSIKIGGENYIDLEHGKIILVVLPEVTKIEADFLTYNESLENINMPKVLEIGDNFLKHNTNLRHLSLPQVKTIGDSALRNCSSMTLLHINNVQKIGDYSFTKINNVSSLCLPKLDSLGECSFEAAAVLTYLNLPKIKIIPEKSFASIPLLNSLNLPEVQEIRDRAFFIAPKLYKAELPKVKKIGDNCFYNSSLKKLNAPLVVDIGDSCFVRNELTAIDLPKVKNIGEGFMSANYDDLISVNLPKVDKISHGFLRENNSLKELLLPKVKKIGNYALEYNRSIITLDLPNVKIIGQKFLAKNRTLLGINMPKVKTIGHGFLGGNKILANFRFGIQKLKNYLKNDNSFEKFDLSIYPSAFINRDIKTI